MARLQRSGQRRRSGALWCKVLEDETIGHARLAFAIGRPVGPAVVRNRLRRRLRAIVRDLAIDNRVAPGWYLIGARPEAAALTFAQLTTDVTSMMARSPA